MSLLISSSAQSIFKNASLCICELSNMLLFFLVVAELKALSSHKNYETTYDTFLQVGEKGITPAKSALYSNTTGHYVYSIKSLECRLQYVARPKHKTILTVDTNSTVYCYNVCCDFFSGFFSVFSKPF